MRNIKIDLLFVILAIAAVWCGATLFMEWIMGWGDGLLDEIQTRRQQSILSPIPVIEKEEPINWWTTFRIIIVSTGLLTTLYHLTFGRWTELGEFLLITLLRWRRRERERQQIETRVEITSDAELTLYLIFAAFLLGSANPFFFS